MRASLGVCAFLFVLSVLPSSVSALTFKSLAGRVATDLNLLASRLTPHVQQAHAGVTTGGLSDGAIIAIAVVCAVVFLFLVCCTGRHVYFSRGGFGQREYAAAPPAAAPVTIVNNLPPPQQQLQQQQQAPPTNTTVVV